EVGGVARDRVGDDELTGELVGDLGDDRGLTDAGGAGEEDGKTLGNGLLQDRLSLGRGDDHGRRSLRRSGGRVGSEPSRTCHREASFSSWRSPGTASGRETASTPLSVGGGEPRKRSGRRPRPSGGLGEGGRWRGRRYIMSGSTAGRARPGHRRDTAAARTS